MSEQRKEYRNIAKGTAIFGGVQVFNMLINILRGKFIAILLGPAGMGVSALLNSTVNTINQITSLGLNIGAMRDISIAHQKGDIERLSLVAKIFRRLVFMTGVVGALVSLAGSYWWSEIAFGNDDYTLAFVVLGLMLFFTALASAETALLQGTRHLRDLAQTSLLGSVVGLVIGVPMYYFFGTAGIAPAMVALALSTYISNRFFARKIELKVVVVTKSDTKLYARQMIMLGVALTVAGLLGTLSVYFINWFIRFSGGLDDVGLYQASNSITTQYIGFIFSAMAVDYFPRLAAVSDDNKSISTTANQQAEMVILIATPIIILLLTTAPFVVKLLLSEAFMPTVPVLRWMGFALFFKAAAYALGYISFAKGDKKTFFIFEGIVGNLLTIVCSILGYWFWGFLGLGIAVLASMVMYYILISFVVIRKYQFKFNKGFMHLFCVLFLFCLTTFLASLWVHSDVWYGVIGGVMLLVAGWYCSIELNKRMQIVQMIKTRFKR